MSTDFLRMVEGVQKRDVILEAEASWIGGMRQQAQVRVINPASRVYTLVCDEGEHMGGEDSAAPPLVFFMAGLAC